MTKPDKLMREAFDKWAMKTGYDPHHHAKHIYENAWESWQAAIAWHEQQHKHSDDGMWPAKSVANIMGIPKQRVEEIRTKHLGYSEEAQMKKDMLATIEAQTNCLKQPKTSGENDG